MRQYFAILKDSFREALASRVLWILLILITAVLLITAPLGLKEERSSLLVRSSVRNWPALIARIEDETRAEGPTPGKQIWARLSSRLKESLAKADEDAEENSGDVIP